MYSYGSIESNQHVIQNDPMLPYSQTGAPKGRQLRSEGDMFGHPWSPPGA